MAAADYGNALSQSAYSVFSADINGDGRADLLLKATVQMIPVHLDEESVVNIPVPPLVASFVLLSSASGSYRLDPTPSEATVNNSAWQSNAAVLSFGRLHGSGPVSMLIQGAGAGAPSFTVAVSDQGTPQLLQQLTTASIGVDLGAAGVTVQLKDSNGDARADLLVRKSGRLTSVLLADTGGMFHPDGTASATAVWQNMLQELDNGSSTGAAAYFTKESQGTYQSMFSALGDDMKSVAPTFSNLRFMSMRPEAATAVITRNYNGATTMHYITFIADGNDWSIREF